MAPSRKRGAKVVEPNAVDFRFGDLVLVKVKGFPFWPAKVSRPEEHERTPDPRKYFVKFFGTGEIAFVGPADIQAFTGEKKIELSQGKSKPFRDFGKAVKEICEEFEDLQHKDLNCKDLKVLDDKIKFKRLALSGKAENQQPSRVQMNEDNNSDEEDHIPIMERYRRRLESLSSPLISENKLVLRKNGLVLADKIQSPVTQLPAKRRSVNLCDDDQDELPKTPIHGGLTSKVSAIQHVPASNNKPVKHAGNNKPVTQLPAKRRSVILCDDDQDELTKTPIHGGLTSKVSAIQHVPASNNKPVKHAGNNGVNKLLSRNLGAIGSFKEEAKPSQALDAVSRPLVSTSEVGNSLLRKNGLVISNKCRPQVKQPPTKRRAVLLCDDGGRDELPKTPIHGGSIAAAQSPFNGHENEEIGGNEAAVSRNAFQEMLETLSGAKESIWGATDKAIDCAKHGIATEVVELLVKKLENEPIFRRRVDFFFLVDSITKCSYKLKGVAAASFIPIIQSALPRLLGAAAPPGRSTKENRRQCHKVLRVWLEKNILPESVLRRYMDEIRVENDDNSAGFLLRRPSRYERGVDDPIRDMEGMFVDEYGSNVTFSVPGLLPCHAFDDEEDEDGFLTNVDKVKEFSPPIHTRVACTDPEKDHVAPIDQDHVIVGDVAGELEMEDISGQQKDYKVISINGTTQSEQNPDRTKEPYQIGSDMNNESLPSPNSPPLPDGTPAPNSPPLPDGTPPPLTPSSPPLPDGTPPPTPPLPTSPPPPLSSPPPSSSPSPPPQRSRILQQHLFPPQPSPAPQTSYSTAPPPYAAHVPPLVSQQHQPAFMSQHRLPPPSLVQPYAQRPLRPECPPHPPSQFTYINSVQQYQYPLPHSFPNLRRDATDEQWHMQVNRLSADNVHGGWLKAGRSSSAPYLQEGYSLPTERRPPSVVTFQPSGPNALPAVTPIPVHGMMLPRPDMSTVNWRPA